MKFDAYELTIKGNQIHNDVFHRRIYFTDNEILIT